MAKKELNINKQFMIGNGIMAFAVLAIVMIFTYMAFTLKRNPDKVTTYQGVYLLNFAPEWIGQHATIYLNDSLLWDQIVPQTPPQITIKQWHDENLLQVVDPESDMASSFNLNKEGSRIQLKKQGNVVSIIESKTNH
ncbi:MAG: hypothetical protein ACRCUJ_04870 [Phocaeicola sp.]